jgi:TP901-1 family phage major tail protein
MAATKLDSSKDIYRGELFLFVKPDGLEETDPLPIAFATTATIEITTEEVDISNKMMGGWAGSLPGKKSFTASTEALITRKEGAMSYDTLLDAQINGKVLDFFFGEATVADQDNNGGTFTPDKTKKNYTGRVMITSQSVTSEAGQIAKLSASFKGIGALTPVDGTTQGG